MYKDVKVKNKHPRVVSVNLSRSLLLPVPTAKKHLRKDKQAFVAAIVDQAKEFARKGT